MKNKSDNILYHRGFSTLEMLIAMLIIILALTAVILVSFGNQSAIADSQADSQALNKAQSLLEYEQALARKDFNLVNPTAAPDGIYQDNVAVVQQPDYFTKLVTATVSWTGDHNRPESESLSALVTNFENAVGGSTCDSVLLPSAAAWQTPLIKNSVTSFASLVSSAHSFTLSDLDAYEGRLYVTAAKTTAATDSTFFVFDISNPVAPVLKGQTDNAVSTTAGINAVAVATSTLGSYAYAASAYGASFNTATGACVNSNGANTACGQLQIIDISGATPQVKYTFEVPGVVGSSGQAIGESIFYNQGYIYLGLAKTGSGPEFNIIDVHNPLSPQLVGSYAVGYNINAIYVKGQYAYLAHPTDSSAGTQEQLTVLDISSPSAPKRVSGFHAPDNQGNGKSLFPVGDVMYLGRTVTTSANPEFYALDASVPTAIATTPFGSQKISDSVDSLLVRQNLAFLLTGGQTTQNRLQIYQMNQSTNPYSVSQWASPLVLPGGSSAQQPAMDCEGNYLYASSNDSSGNGYVSVISP